MDIKVTVLLPKSLKDACQERAKSLHMTMDYWIRLAIKHKLKEPKTETGPIENSITENKVARLTLLMSEGLANTCQEKAESMGINMNTWIRLAIIDEIKKPIPEFY